MVLQQHQEALVWGTPPCRFPTTCECVSCRELSPALSHLLGVEDVFCDSRSQEAAQQFVLWAGRVLQSR